jgi:hypothetical protein
LNRYAEAERALERSLQLRPNHPRAQLNLNLIRGAIANPPAPPATARRNDAADAMTRRADVSGSDPATAATITNDRATTNRAPESRNKFPNTLPAAPAELVSQRDQPGEILRRRFLIQDTEHPLAAGGQSW